MRFRWFQKKDPYTPTIPSEMAEATIDISSPTWRYLRSWLTKELESARERNDSLSLDITQTSRLRGNIEAYKEILGLPKELSSGKYRR